MIGSVVNGGKRNKSYFASASKSCAKTTTTTVTSITIAEPGTFVVLGSTVCTTSNTSAQVLNLATADSTNVTSFNTLAARSTNANGGGIVVWGLLTCAGKVTMNLNVYNGYSAAATYQGRIMAFKLDQV